MYVFVQMCISYQNRLGFCFQVSFFSASIYELVCFQHLLKEMQELAVHVKEKCMHEH